jgi:uncharacterized protein (DUF2235 family)
LSLSLQKSPTPILEEMCGNCPDISKGVFQSGIRLAYEWLIENYTEGDEIFIFGFSRGAYTARSLAGLIAIPKVGSVQSRHARIQSTPQLQN